ncbi:MAG TPA: cyanophycin synthetase [Planctomycetota bacterium]|nr:cyanophycin synthetase [Planctomycetota bacterium]
MRIIDIRTLNGPNVFHNKPVLVMRLDLEDLADIESRQRPEFISKLLKALPGLQEHRCSLGRAGGFVERLHTGTYFGHIVEHVALELSAPAGIEVGFGKTVFSGVPRCYDVAVRFVCEEGMKHLLKTAVEIVEALLNDKPFDLERRLEEARDIVAEFDLGPSTRCIVEAAESRGIPWMRLNDANLIQFGYGKFRRYIQAAMSSQSSAIAVEVSCDKELTKQILRSAFIRVPSGTTVRSEEEAVEAFLQLERPAVVKPLDGRQGIGVSVNLTTVDQVRTAFQIAAQSSSRVLIEEYIRGRNYRVLVVAGRMIAASERIPPIVCGDGRSSIRDLVDAVNRDPRRGKGHDKPMTRMRLDDVTRECLHKQGFEFDSVPASGVRVILRESVNLSTGGSAIDVTDLVHPDIRRMCERAARVVDLDICGIDVVHDDISKPFTDESGAIIELNAAPGLRMHLFPSEGKPRDVGGAIISSLYPEFTPSRIPLIAVTGTNGKTTTSRMIAHVLEAARYCVGLTSTDGIYIGGRKIFCGDNAGPMSARAVLADPSVEIAVLETARGGIVRRGLGYDWSDISIVTNIQADHIGQDGIDSVDDLVRIKSLVPERTREGGTIILNADDPRTAALADAPRIRRLPRRIIYFSLDPENSILQEHLAAGGKAFFLKDNIIHESHRSGRPEPLVEAGTLPITLGGRAAFQIANVLAALAACRAHGLKASDVINALQNFHSDENPGRANLYQVKEGYVLLDYGHNAPAFEAICGFAARWNGYRTTGIVTVPGDRRDDLIENAASVAARGFRRLIIREDKNTRGRVPGAIAEMMCRAARTAVPGIDCQVIPDELQALKHALDTMSPGELIILFYESTLADAVELLKNYGAVPQKALPAAALAG